MVLQFLLVGCPSNNEKIAKQESLSPEALVVRGRSVYVSNCLSCHGPDPRIDGPVGPSLAGSSEELLRLRVLYLKYPEGYKPKRLSGQMVALPHLEKEIPALHAYLNSLASDSH